MRAVSLLLLSTLLGACSGGGGGAKAACEAYVEAVQGCYDRAGGGQTADPAQCDDPTWNEAAVYDCMADLYEAGNCNDDFTMISITDGLPDCYAKEL